MLLLSGGAVRAVGADAGAAQQLADRYAPVVMLKKQARECDSSGEAYGPSSVNPIFGQPDFLLTDDGTTVLTGPTANDLYEKPVGYAIDYPGSPLDPGCSYDELARRLGMGVPPRDPVAYAHVVTQEDAPGKLALQYWLFYLFNDYNNLHEGDWEMAQLVFDADTAEEALATSPVEIGLSQHNAGERAAWSDPKLQKEGDRPVIYPGQGSHANFYGEGLWLERSPSEGVGCDDTRGPSVRVPTRAVLLPGGTPAKGSSLEWITYQGQWGAPLRAPYDGPPGPNMTDRWTQPITWQQQTRESSTAIPDVGSEIVTSSFCAVVEWGSGLLTDLGNNPLITVIALAVIAVFLIILIRATRWNSVPISPTVRRRHAGQMIRSALSLMRRHPLHTLSVGVVFIPIAVVAGLIGWGISNIPLGGPILSELAEERSLLWLGAVSFAVPGGIIGYIVAIMLVSAWVRLRDAQGSTPPVRAVLHEASMRLGDVARAVALRTVQIVALGITILGIPWALKLLVETQLLTQVCVIENRAGRDARWRARQLTHHAWLRVALISLLASLVPLVIAPMLAMPILLLQMPVWFVNLMGAVFAAALTPVAALVMVLLYGDRAAAVVGEALEDDGLAATPTGVGA